MQLLRCLLAIIYAIDIARAQKNVQAGPRSLQLCTPNHWKNREIKKQMEENQI